MIHAHQNQQSINVYNDKCKTQTISGIRLTYKVLRLVGQIWGLRV